MVDAAAALAALAGRDLDTEGIGMYLALAGARPAAAGHPLRDDGSALASVVEEVHAALAAHGGADPAQRLVDAVAIAAHAELDGWELPRKDGEAPLPVADAGLAEHLSALRQGRFVRVVNYHNTPASRSEALVAELSGWAGRYSPVDEAGLEALFAGRWDRPAAPLLPVFYEGYRNNYEVAAPACRAAGLTGWFFVISGFIDSAPGDQHDFAAAHQVALVAEEAGRERIAMTWDEVGEVAADHVVSPHTATHAAASEVRLPDDFERQVVEPAAAVRFAAGRPGPAHAWLLGTPLRPGEEHAAALRSAGVTWCFSNTAIQSTDQPAPISA